MPGGEGSELELSPHGSRTLAAGRAIHPYIDREKNRQIDR